MGNICTATCKYRSDLAFGKIRVICNFPTTCSPLDSFIDVKESVKPASLAARDLFRKHFPNLPLENHIDSESKVVFNSSKSVIFELQFDFSPRTSVLKIQNFVNALNNL